MLSKSRRHLLFAIMLALDGFLASLVIYSWSLGIVPRMIAGDNTGFMMWLILWTGLGAIVWAGVNSWLAIRRRSCAIQVCRALPAILTGLGLLGTVMGLIIMVNSMTFDVGNVAAMRDALGSFVLGLGLAINTTIAGLVFALWATIGNVIIAIQHEADDV